MIERIYILCLIIIIKSEVWTITHCLGLGHETMICAVCLSVFLLKWSVIWYAIWRSCNGHSKNTIYFRWLQNNRIYPSVTFSGRRDVSVIQLGISVKQTRLNLRDLIAATGPVFLLKIGFKSLIFGPVCPGNLMEDLKKQWATSSILCQALCIISKPSVNSNWSHSSEMLNLGQNWWFFCPLWPQNLTDDLEKQ